MPAQKLHIPEEILDGVVQCLNPQMVEDLQALARLSRVSRGLHRLVVPVLYRSFPGQQHVNPGSWLKAILARPGRELLVRHVTVHEFVRWRDGGLAPQRGGDRKTAAGLSDVAGQGGDDGRDDDQSSDEDMELLTPREIQLLPTDESCGRLDDAGILVFRQLVQKAKLTPRNRGRLDKAGSESLRRGARSTSVDLVMSLLVLLCAELETIDIWRCDGFHQALLPIALTCRRGSVARVSLHRNGERDHRGPGAVETLGRLRVLERRNVEHLSVTNDSLRYLIDPGGQDMFGPWPSLKHLSLKACAVPAPALEILLRESPALTSLELRMEDALEPCGHLLRAYGRGLRRLVVDVDSSSCWAEEPSERFGAGKGLYGLGSLQQLTVLEELEVAPWALLRLGDGPRVKPNYRFIELLPLSLRSLTILPLDFDLGSDFDEQLELLRLVPAFANLTLSIL